MKKRKTVRATKRKYLVMLSVCLTGLLLSANQCVRRNIPYAYEDLNITCTSPDGMSNCYILPAGYSLQFKAVRAFVCTETEIGNTLRIDGLDYDGEMGYTVAWTSNEEMIEKISIKGKGPKAMVTIESREKQYGNLIVNLYRLGDRYKIPIWSYHIWVPETQVTHYNDGWMDRPLGALLAEDTDRETDTLDYEIPLKTLDDPCPHGYYLPEKDKSLMGAKGIPDYSYITDPYPARQIRCRKNCKLEISEVQQL